VTARGRKFPIRRSAVAGLGFGAGAVFNLIAGVSGAQFLFARGFNQIWFAALAVAAGAIEGGLGGFALDGMGAACGFAIAFALRPAIYNGAAAFVFALGAWLAPNHPESAEFIRGAAGGAIIFGLAGALGGAIVYRRTRAALAGLWTFGVGGAVNGVVASRLIRSIIRGATTPNGWCATVLGLAGPAIAIFLAGALFALSLIKED
jgi:hypothetical protein